MNDRDWMIDAACRKRDPEMFFPGPKDRLGQLAAKRVCIDCPVFTQCDTYRRQTKPSHGVWAAEFLNERSGFRTNSTARNRCGTTAAYRRHLRHGERPCDACGKAGVYYNAERRAQRQQAKGQQ